MNKDWNIEPNIEYNIGYNIKDWDICRTDYRIGYRIYYGICKIIECRK